MVDPVSTVDGQTYERSAIAMWLEKHDTSPVTNEPLPLKMLIPNFSLRELIQQHLQGGVAVGDARDPSRVEVRVLAAGRTTKRERPFI